MKTYIKPSVEIRELNVVLLTTLSIQNGAADDSEVLSRENIYFNLWDEE